MFKTETVKIVGGTNKRWGQIFAEDNLFLVLEMKGIEGAAEIGRRIIEKVEKDYQELSERSLNSLKKLLASLELTENISLIIGTVKKNILYLVAQGEGEVRIKRGGSWATILKGKGSSSGFLKEGDIIVLSSPTFKKLVSGEEFSKLLVSFSLKEVEESLAALIQTARENEGAAGLLIKFTKEEGAENLKMQIRKKTKRVANFFVNFFKRPRTPLFKERERIEKGGRLTASVALILIILLIGSLIFGSQQKEKNLQQQEWEKIKEKVIPQIKEGKDLIDLNIFRARSVLLEAKNSLEESLPKFKSNSKKQKEVEKMLAEVNEALGSAQRSFKLSEVPLFFDLAWIKEEANGSSFALYQNSLVILDKKTKNVYQLDVLTKKAQILGSGEDLGFASKIAHHGESVFILLSGEKVRIINPRLEVVVEKDEEWGEIADFTAYAGNLYLLDKKGIIWKYPRLERGFGSRQNYLAYDIVPDFTQALAMVIDGAIWVLNQGRVTKFVAGIPESFSFKEFEEDLKEPIDLFTNEESENIYLLDKEGKIVVFDKEGRYQAQYSWEKLPQASDFVVSESLQKIFVLLRGKIYAIAINQR